MGVRAADVAVERKVALVGSGFGHRERYSEECVRAEPGLVVRAVERDQRLVDQPLVQGLEPDHRLADLVIDVGDRALDTLAAVAVAAVAQLDGLVRAGARPARDGRPPACAREQLHLDLDGRVASRVQNLSRIDVDDGAHSPPSVVLLWTECRM